MFFTLPLCSHIVVFVVISVMEALRVAVLALSLPSLSFGFGSLLFVEEENTRRGIIFLPPPPHTGQPRSASVT